MLLKYISDGLDAYPILFIRFVPENPHLAILGNHLNPILRKILLLAIPVYMPE